MIPKAKDVAQAWPKTLKVLWERRRGVSAPMAGDRTRIGPMAHQEPVPTLEREPGDALRCVQAALECLDSGAFGLCLRCGGGLEAMPGPHDPAAPTCSKCSGDQQ